MCVCVCVSSSLPPSLPLPPSLSGFARRVQQHLHILSGNRSFPRYECTRQAASSSRARLSRLNVHPMAYSHIPSISSLFLSANSFLIGPPVINIHTVNASTGKDPAKLRCPGTNKAATHSSFSAGAGAGAGARACAGTLMHLHKHWPRAGQSRETRL